MTTEMITWQELIEIEPRLRDMLLRLRAVKDPGNTPSFCANAVWYGHSKGGHSYKNELTALVGWDAKSENPRIKTSQAYDTAYRKLYAVLPNCRNCNCL